MCFFMNGIYKLNIQNIVIIVDRSTEEVKIKVAAQYDRNIYSSVLKMVMCVLRMLRGSNFIITVVMVAVNQGTRHQSFSQEIILTQNSWWCWTKKYLFLYKCCKKSFE